MPISAVIVLQETARLKELKEEQVEYQKDLKEIVEKIKGLQTAGYSHVFTGNLTEIMLPDELHDSLQKKYTVLSFNCLAQSGQTFDRQLLEEDTEHFYTYRGGREQGSFTLKSPLEVLQPLADEYMKKTGTYHYGIVLEHIKNLAGRNLTNFRLNLLEKRKATLEELASFNKERIQDAVEEATMIDKILQTDPNVFQRGNFGFIAHSMSRGNVEHIFDAIEKENLWHKLPRVSEYHNSHPLFRDPEFCKKVLHIADAKDGHSGASMDWTVCQLIHLKEMGWERFRNEWIAAYPGAPAPSARTSWIDWIPGARSVVNRVMGQERKEPEFERQRT